MGTGQADKEGMILSEAIGKSQNCFFVKGDSQWTYKDASSLKEVTLGVIQGYTFDDEGIMKHFEAAKDKVDYAPGENGMETNFKKLQAGRIGAYLDDKAVMDYFIEKNPAFKGLKNAGCTPASEIYVGFSSKNPKSAGYVEILNKGVQDLRKSGELKKILDKYGYKDWVQ